MPNESNRIAVLEARYEDIAGYMEDGEKWREETTRQLAIVINQQKNYQDTCERDRVAINSRLVPLETAKNRQAGMAVIISALAGTITAGLIAIVAAVLGRAG